MGQRIKCSLLVFRSVCFFPEHSKISHVSGVAIVSHNISDSIQQIRINAVRLLDILRELLSCFADYFSVLSDGSEQANYLPTKKPCWRCFVFARAIPTEFLI